MKLKTKIIILAALALVIIGAVFIWLNRAAVKQFISPQPQATLKEQTTTTATTTQPEPEKTDFGAKVPTDFPTDIPIDKGAAVQQSYGLNYIGQKQLSIVFLSTKTVKENYSLYSDFLKKQKWNILNTYESAKLSSLYGTKESNDINVTISENTSSASIKSQVSISVMKKL